MEDGEIEIEEGMVTEEEAPRSEMAAEDTVAPTSKVEISSHELLRESKMSVEEIVAKMLSIKREGKPKSEIRELLTQMFLNFVNLRQANRSILMEEDRVKAETERAKAPVDFTTLQLHNLMYEKSHYVKAIKACRDFKSKYPDIELVPEEEFFRDAPESIKCPTLSTDTSHDLMLKRLNFELHQRKELCKLRARLEQKKKSLLETIADRKKFLSSLPSHLKSLKKASLPVQNQLGLQHTKKLKQHHLAELLPPPLYVIYSQLLAQKEAFEETIDLEIVGSLKDAQSYARQQANKDPGMSNNMESARFEDDGADEDDDGQRRRKRSKKLSGKESSDQAGLYQAHPLKILLHIYDDEIPDPKSGKLVMLKFEYLSKLNIVCVSTEGSQNGSEVDILCNLFPDDTGLDPPHQSAKLILGDGQAFDESRTSRPYKWAQHLAGIDFLPEMSPFLAGQDIENSDATKKDASMTDLSLYRQQHRVQMILQRLRSRKKAQLALVEQLDSLMKLQLPALNSEGVPWALHKTVCALDSWLVTGLSASGKSSSLPPNSMEQLPEPMEMEADGRFSSSKDEAEGAREDGELPSLVTAASVINDAKLTPTKVSSLAQSRQFALMTKNLDSPINKGKSPSFKKYDDDLDLVLDPDSDIDESAQTKVEEILPVPEKDDNSWVDIGTREFLLVLSRSTNTGGKSWKLEAKVKISVEYPLRPPLFALSLHASSGNDETNQCKHHNELRSMEAEVNLHMLQMVPPDEQNYLLSHQIRCLAMLFDYLMDEFPSPHSESGTSTSIVDIGLCKPVGGKLLVRSFRGRDHRRMISWKEKGCASGYPC